MKSLYTIAVVGAVMLSSCSVYRQGQTPDDVYYSPAREQQGAGADYVDANSGRNDGRRYDDRRSYNGYDDYATMDDRWLMMRVRNRYRWSYFDDYNFYSPYSSFYSPYGFGGWSPYNSLGFGYAPGWSFGLGFGAYNPYGFGFNNYYNNHWNWNSYYNPYYPGVVIVNPKTNPAGYTRARSFNLNRYNNSYNTSGRTSVTPRYNNTNYGRVRYNNSNNSRVNSSDRYYNNNSNRERPSYSTPRQDDRPVRTYTPSNSPSYSPSSSGSTGGGAPASGSRPSRR
jgi:hypothetical protein